MGVHECVCVCVCVCERDCMYMSVCVRACVRVHSCSLYFPCRGFVFMQQQVECFGTSVPHALCFPFILNVYECSNEA